MAFAFGATPNPDKSEKVGKENEDSSSEIHRIDEAAQQQEIARIGRELSQLSSRHGGSPTDIFDQDSESPLNPHSASFNGRKWLKAMLDLGAPETQRTAGVSFRNLSAYGFGSDSDWQKTVGNIPLTSVGALKGLFGFKGRRIQILDGFDGLLLPGELLTVLGPPGSGCSSLLKTLAGDTHGFEIDANSSFNYSGIDYATFHSRFAGESVYSAEVEVLSVGDTLRFAAYARSPRTVPGGIDRWEYSNHMAAAIMSMLGISHTWNTRVGNDLIRGVSGGERKRVSIAEVMLAGAPLQMWDNSTRGLDSANAIEFVKSLRTSAEITGSAAAVAIYQAPGAAYDCFDKVTVLYSGRQIYFGPTLAARDFFIDMGFECPTRQTTADFLTSLTSPAERVVRQGFEGRVPNTPDEFAARWKASETYAQLIRDIDAYNDKHPIGGPTMDAFKAARRAHQGRGTRASSPFTLSYADQIKLCTTRGFWRLKGDPSLTLTQIIGNSVMQLIISSVFYNLRPTTASFYSRGALLFFAILLAAFASALEILTLYAQMRTCQAQSTARPHADSSQRQRPIIEKHHRYAFTRPSAEAWASVICDLPYKTLNCITSNLILYFMTNLRRTPGSFFFFLFVSYLTTLVMSGFFRSVASLSRSLSQALTPAAVVILGLVMYSGFAVPYPTMLGWSSWIFRINPVAYAFELLAINEFDGRDFECSNFVPSGPGYEAVGGLNRACVAVGAVPGSTVVSGTAYINTSFQYYGSHRGRNIGILFAFLIFFMTVYIAATELISAKRSKGEVLVFRQGHQPAKAPTDIESRVGPDEKGPQSKSQADIGAVIAKQTAVFSFEDICFDVQIKKENRRILDHVDGYVKPGTLTALMGVSGAGKTSLLDALATRTTMGVLSGEALVDGRPRDASFQRKTGYVQQQDLHLETTTVREALIFSAVLRQPAHLSRKEKVDYVDEVIRLLEMEEYADAVVGVPGEGLNVEQRKRLTIGVELAAKPELLLFLDEPTSGLDSQTAWAICDLMEKLAKSGQSILCTIHQPSAMLFQRFDRLLFLAKGGKTVYFGDIGKNSRTLVDYFEGNGAPACPPEANPAEWILEAIGAAPGSSTTIDWHATWNRSPEKADVKRHLAELKEERPKITRVDTTSANKAAYREFAASYLLQWREVQYRVFQQYWRTPTYIAAKTVLCVACALFIGFTFYAPNAASLTQQAVQNQLYSIMLFTIFGQLVQQIMPHFVVQRSLYEARERPSKVYSWFIFMISNIFVELPYATLVAILVFACWYFSVGFYSNAAVTSTQHTRALTFQLFLWLFFLFQSTFTHMCIAAITNAEEGGNIANLLFALSLIFCGVLATPSQFPGFWIWMYRVSPFTYFTEGFLTVGLADTPMACSNAELTRFAPPAGQTCATYLETFFTSAPGAIVDPSSTTECAYCAYTNTNEQLAQLNLSFANRWRDFGLLWIYILFNIAAACALYYLVRVPRPKMEETTKPEPTIESDAGSSQRSEKV